ncbi:MAG: hypothetical protein QXN87_00430 [Candidatus Bathyarchaeia archaeon]
MPQTRIRMLKTLTVMFIICVFAILHYYCPPVLKAETEIKTKIISVTPTSGKVGEKVNVMANITTLDGEYLINFGTADATKGRSVGNLVNASFMVPQAVAGSHNITLIDLSTGEKDVVSFNVITSYIIKIENVPEQPFQYQQGDEVKILIGIQGGKANERYMADITVQTPNINITHKPQNLQLILTSSVGSGNITITYPSEFNGAKTNLSGAYNVFFNKTLAAETFIIGLTKSSEYHRGDTVDIKATYAPKENVTLKIVGKNVIHFENLTADDRGLVHHVWIVPQYATVTSYEVNINSVSKITVKDPLDIQNFTVPGFKTEICPLNLADQTVPEVLVRVYDNFANETREAWSNQSGVATFWLEKGSYNATLYFEEVKVGRISDFSVITGEERINILCNLTNINVIVVDAKSGVKMPFIQVSLTYNYISEKGENKTGKEKVSLTDINGTLNIRSLLVNAVYKVNASRYGHVFYENVFRPELKPCNDIKILCPSRTLNLKINDRTGQLITDAEVELEELMGGIRYELSAPIMHPINCTFGIYRLRVYSREVLLNETEIEVFIDRDVTINCALYNLPIFIKVVDYFGQPIPKVNVTLERNGVIVNSGLTDADGMVRFVEIGGALAIQAYMKDKRPEASLLTFIGSARSEANPVVVKLENYVMLAGFPVITAHLVAAILIIAALILFISIEAYSQRRLKIKSA